MTIAEDLFNIAEQLEAQWKINEDDNFSGPIQKLLEAANQIGKAWSGSWLGYHSTVYYKDFKESPLGTHFNPEWGFMQKPFYQSTIGDWEVYRFDDVINVIYRTAENPDIEEQKRKSIIARECFEESQFEIQSKLSALLSKQREDSFLQERLDDVKNIKIYKKDDIISSIRPSGQIITRDMKALHEGLSTPPHFFVMADIMEIELPFKACKDIATITRRTAKHIRNTETTFNQRERIGKNVFIGHGRSSIWKDLKDFIQDRMYLPWDEFNRVSSAGVTNIARLSQMLDGAAIAFMILTAEDELAGGQMVARQNVIHEAGLFQGRLGFNKAIILLEEGCEEFSNIQGLGQIRFPKGNISGIFEDLRRVLEREGLIK